jgi:signal peptidase I
MTKMTERQSSHAATDPASSASAPSASRSGQLLRDTIEVVILVTVIFFGIKLSVETRPISGDSMLPGLHNSQTAFVNKLAYVFGAPQRGDVIIFYYPRDTQEVFIKRIIGIPGDTVTIARTSVTVNGVTLNEPYISAADNCAVQASFGTPCVTQTVTLKANQYWVMGDNRLVSDDSRIWGELNRSYIIGEATATVWPFSNLRGIDTYRSVFAHIPAPSQHASTPTPAPDAAWIILLAPLIGLRRLGARAI